MKPLVSISLMDRLVCTSQTSSADRSLPLSLAPQRLILLLEFRGMYLPYRFYFHLQFLTSYRHPQIVLTFAQLRNIILRAYERHKEWVPPE